MDKQLITRGLTKYLAGLVLLGLLIFLPAGTLRFGKGWLFLALLFLPMLAMGIVLLLRDPELLRKRLDSKEQENTQKGVVLGSGLMFLTGFILCGLHHRFGWKPEMPAWAVIAASVLFLAGYAMYAEVLRENTYLARTVSVQEGQRVIDTGLYGVVRHPMYLATLLMFLSMPLVLGSLWGFLVFLAYPVLIAVRIRNEEQVLSEGLTGYRDYQQKVKYRLIPLIW